MRVLLYPWFGSKPSQIAKYKDMYTSLFGSVTKVDIVPYKITQAALYSNWKGIRNGCLNSYVSEREYDCIHMISGGCLIAYNQLKSVRVKYDKVIFDSGPYVPSAYHTANYIVEQLPGKPHAITPLMKRLIGSYWSMEGFDIDLELKQYREWLHGNKNNLTMINRSDNLIDIDEIDLFAGKSNSIMQTFDSEHAQFLRYEPDKYKETILEYLS